MSNYCNLKRNLFVTSLLVLTTAYLLISGAYGQKQDLCTRKLRKAKRCNDDNVFEEHTRLLPKDYCLKASIVQTCYFVPKKDYAEVVVIVKSLETGPDDSLMLYAEDNFSKKIIEYGPYTDRKDDTFSIITGSGNVKVQLNTSSEELRYNRLLWIGYTASGRWTFTENAGNFSSPIYHKDREDPFQFTLNIKPTLKDTEFRVTFKKTKVNNGYLEIKGSTMCDKKYEGNFPKSFTFENHVAITLRLEPPYKEEDLGYSLSWGESEDSDEEKEECEI